MTTQIALGKQHSRQPAKEPNKSADLRVLFLHLFLLAGCLMNKNSSTS
jgi:hypothetical protein